MNEETVIEMEQPAGVVDYKQHPMPLAPAPFTPASLLQIAVQRGASLDEMQKLMDLMERHERNTAKKAFDEAKAAFSAENILITKDKANNQYKSKYSSIGNLVNTARPFLGKHGFSTSWSQTQEGGKITVTCRMSHAQGHFEEDSFEVPPDKSGAKNALQEVKSAITYARVTTFENVTGLVSSDESGDDDGNGYGRQEKTVAKPCLKEKGFNAAIAAVRKGDVTAQLIRDRHELTVDQETALSDVEKELKK